MDRYVLQEGNFNCKLKHLRRGARLIPCREPHTDRTAPVDTALTAAMERDEAALKSERLEGRNQLSQTLGLCRMPKVVEVHDCIEDQRIAPHRLSAVHRIVCEQQHVAFAQVRVDHDGMLGDGGLVAQ